MTRRSGTPGADQGRAAAARRKRQSAGVLLVALGLFIALSFLPHSGAENPAGWLGAASSRLLLELLSWGGLLLPVLAVLWGVVLFRGRGAAAARRFSAVAAVGALACLTTIALFCGPTAPGPAERPDAATDPSPAAGQMLASDSAAPERARAEPGGRLAAEIARGLRGAFGAAGALVVLALGVLLTLLFALEEGVPWPARTAVPPGGSPEQPGRVRAAAARGAQALLWTAGVVAAAAVWLVSWVGGLLGVLGVAVGAARSRLRRRPLSSEAADAGGAAGVPPSAAGRVGPAARPTAPERPRAAAAAADGGAVEWGLGPGPRGDPAGDWAGAWVGGPAAGAPGPATSAGPAARRGRGGAEVGVPYVAPSPRRAGRVAPEPVWEVPLELFDAPVPRDVAASERELEELGGVLVRKLADFNVHGDVVRISSGPVITQFEVEPAPGIKVNQIANLADDLALAMRAQRIRIVAPIPGRGAVGIEIPNARPEPVTIRELLGSAAFRDFRGVLPFALGKEISGAPIVADLARMPHLLIAGSTGSGKSVCINALLTSLLYRFSPSELRLVLVDPKMLELSMYDEVPHLLHPVVTRPKEAAVALKWAVYEMDRRFELLARNGVRNVADFNARLQAGGRLDGVDSPLGSADEPLHPLPYVVVVVDELADLMLTVQAEVEEPLARLAQKARAVGIHVVLATQRPSVNVLTGFIKANFPSRISFQVASKTDSRTVLDQNGAEALLGSGDMLFLPADRAVPIRIQGAYVSGRETEALVAHARALGEALLRELAARADAREITMRETIDLQKVEGADLDQAGGGERDELFFDAARVVIEHDQGSTSLLQRRLKVGYSRAARIVDQLHQHGVLGPPEGSKPREVRIGLEELAEMQAASRGAGTSPPSRSTSGA